MLLQISDWLFDLNLQETMDYSTNILADHCQCGYCRNFYQTIDSSYPQLRPFLAQFGMHPETPEEMMPFEPTLCMASYCVSGKVIQRGNSPLEIDRIVFSVEDQESTDYDTTCPTPYFVLRTGYLELPWVLEEDMDEVISPANEPEYLLRMQRKLLEDNTLEDYILS